MRTKKRLSISGRKALTGWVFSIPFLIGFFLFFLVPVIHSGILSFHTITAGPTMKFVGWQHYYDLFFTNAEYIPKLKESLLNLLICCSAFSSPPSSTSGFTGGRWPGRCSSCRWSSTAACWL